MRLKIENKLNILPIGVFLIWVIYILYFFFFKINSFANETSCGAGILMFGFPIITIALVILILLLIAIINLSSKKRFYADYSLIALILFFMIMCLFINILLIRLFQ